jgi:hypothetical protein
VVTGAHIVTFSRKGQLWLRESTIIKRYSINTMEMLNFGSKQSVWNAAFGLREGYRGHLGTIWDYSGYLGTTRDYRGRLGTTCNQKQVKSEEFRIRNLENRLYLPVRNTSQDIINSL